MQALKHRDCCAGAFDLQDGPATSEAWIDSLQWPGREAFAASSRAIWRSDPNGTVSYYDPELASPGARVRLLTRPSDNEVLSLKIVPD